MRDIGASIRVRKQTRYLRDSTSAKADRFCIGVCGVFRPDRTRAGKESFRSTSYCEEKVWVVFEPIVPAREAAGPLGMPIVCATNSAPEVAAVWLRDATIAIGRGVAEFVSKTGRVVLRRNGYRPHE